MEEEIVFYANDTVRGIDKMLERVRAWRDMDGGNPHVNGREAALVITKLEEARFWAMQMVKRD